MNRHTGAALSGIEHVQQSIIDILTTPLGSRVMRRDYGSRLFQLVDAPINRATLIDIYAAVAEALLKWEPRFRVTRVQVVSAVPGRVCIDIEGDYRPTQTPMILQGITL